MGPKRDRADVIARIETLGLHDRLSERPEGWKEGVPASEREAGEALIARMRANASAANASDGRLGTALGWLELFAQAFPSRVLFLPLGGESHYSNAVHNEETFGMLQEFIRAQGSRKAGSGGAASAQPRAEIGGEGTAVGLRCGVWIRL